MQQLPSYVLILFINTLFFTACTNDVDKNLLVNNWQGVEVTFGDQTNKVPNVRLELKEDKTYSFTDITGSTQTGNYSTMANMLYLKREGKDKISMEVEEVNGSQLVVNLNPGAIPMVMTLKAAR